MKPLFVEVFKNIRAHYGREGSRPFIMSAVSIAAAAAAGLWITRGMDADQASELLPLVLAGLFSMLIPLCLRKSLRAELDYNSTLFGTPYTRLRGTVIAGNLLSNFLLPFKSALTGAAVFIGFCALAGVAVPLQTYLIRCALLAGSVLLCSSLFTAVTASRLPKFFLCAPALLAASVFASAYLLPGAAEAAAQNAFGAAVFIAAGGAATIFITLSFKKPASENA
ncbi:MAG: hypothetical protein FWE62_01570 [Firmicutes bacterium]|nr:hypothetical protein [Bacillota bacterium]